MCAARATRQPPVDLQTLLPGLRSQAEEQGLLKTADLSRAGVPKRQLAEALALLQQQGLEPIRGGLRVPLALRLSRLLRERGSLALAGLRAVLKGAAAKELRGAVQALVESGEARIVLRRKVEVLALPSLPAFTRDELRAVTQAAKELAQLGGKALKHPSATLLREDVREAFVDLLSNRTAPEPVAAPAPTPPAPTLAAPTPAIPAIDLAALLALEVPRHRRDSVQLSFVPDIVRALLPHGVQAVQSALLDAARAGRIELQPDSGLDRLSPEDAALCPPGPQGSVLSWARVLEAKP